MGCHFTQESVSTCRECWCVVVDGEDAPCWLTDPHTGVGPGTWGPRLLFMARVLGLCPTKDTVPGDPQYCCFNIWQMTRGPLESSAHLLTNLMKEALG